MIEKGNDLSFNLNNDSTVNESNFDESFSNSNTYPSSNDNFLEDIDFYVNSYQFEIDSKYKNEIHEYSYDPMIYYILNDNDMYTHDPDISINNKYYK